MDFINENQRRKKNQREGRERRSKHIALSRSERTVAFRITREKRITDSSDQASVRKTVASIWITISSIIFSLTVIAPEYSEIQKWKLISPRHLRSCHIGFNPSPSNSIDCALFNKYLPIASLPQSRLQAYYSVSTESVLCLLVILFSNLLFILLNYTSQNGLSALNLL